MVVEVVIDGEAEDEREEEEVEEDVVEVKRLMAPLPAVTDTKGRRRNPVLTGRLRDPPCQRCIRARKECLEQAGKVARQKQESLHTLCENQDALRQ